MFNYSDVTLDYLFAFISWDLNLRDLKKISLNGIRYSSCNEECKKEIEE
jgi:adenosine deaminase